LRKACAFSTLGYSVTTARWGAVPSTATTLSLKTGLMPPDFGSVRR